MTTMPRRMATGAAIIVIAVGGLGLSGPAAAAPTDHTVSVLGATGSGCDGDVAAAVKGSSIDVRYGSLAARAPAGQRTTAECMASLKIKPRAGYGYRVSSGSQQWWSHQPDGAKSRAVYHLAHRGSLGTIDALDFDGAADGHGVLHWFEMDKNLHGCEQPAPPLDLAYSLTVSASSSPALLSLSPGDGAWSHLNVEFVRCA
ncbi:hypothetical protein [Pilimelia columellifera]|uniref:Secreted protein n=1 Tax=Pilimelia columellifera subsp. columellifera TaxID=706583 RepID=A0ABN3MY49_9ACTN